MAKKKYVATGASFITTGGTDSFRIGDLSATGWDWENDELRILDAATANPSSSMFYLSKAEAVDMLGEGAEAGWYDFDGNCYNDTTVNLGQGFMTRLLSDVTFQSAGQVYQDAFACSYMGATKNAKYNMIPNPLPKTFKLGSISATGWDWENDELRVLDPQTANPTASMFYLTKAEAMDMLSDKDAAAGWYDFDGNCYNDTDVEVGAGFMTRLLSDVTLVFPAAL